MAVERRWTISQLEAALRELKSVCAAKVVIDENGLICEIHLLVEGDRNPKQVVRDVESMLLARFGLSVDHRKISVAQKELYMRGSEFPRLRWVDVQISQEGTRAIVTVLAERNGQLFSGKAAGARSASNVVRLVATATLRAVEAAYGLQERFALEDLNASVVVAGHPAVVTLISVLSDSGEDLLIGSALVRNDLHRTVVAATLDALNRRVLSFPADQSLQPAGGERAVVQFEPDTPAGV